MLAHTHNRAGPTPITLPQSLATDLVEGGSASPKVGSVVSIPSHGTPSIVPCPSFAYVEDRNWRTQSLGFTLRTLRHPESLSRFAARVGEKRVMIWGAGSLRQL